MALGFADHGTFHRRDEANNTRPNTKRYGTFDEHHHPGRPPWEGAVTTGLRDAIEQYTGVWFPGAWTTSAPKNPRGRIAYTSPAAPVARHSEGRTR